MNDMPDEAKLTAFALGELDDSERAEIEARLAADPSLSAQLDEIRQVAGVLEDELGTESVPELTPLQRERLSVEAARTRPTPRRSRRLWVGFSLGGIAALLVIGLAVWSHLGGGRVLDTRYPENPLARRSSAKVMKEAHNDARMYAPAPVLVPTPMPGRPAYAGTPKSDPPDAVPPLRPGAPPATQPDEGFNREAYDEIVENPFRAVADHPLSTFSIDVDTASYALVRRMLLDEARWPVPGAVRIEEMINYFSYDYAPPDDGDDHPFAARTHVARCPWEAGHRLVRIALKGREIHRESRPSGNFVFLLDVSGSMRPPNKLPLVKKAMEMLVEQLNENDSVAIAVYAGASGLVLDATSCDRKRDVHDALARLAAGGSTNGGQGIELAYRVAERNFIRGGVNRVILCTDGDFNVGVTSESALVRLIEEKARGGVFLSVLGFGRGNYQDARMEKLADKGNGNYAYIDTLAEARKVLVEQMTGTLVTIAKDVKIQVEFNPARVAAWRLIGYENHVLAAEDFNDDTKDAGEIGAGHTVTALYEIVPAGEPVPTPAVDPLKYQTAPRPSPAAEAGGVCTVKLRYKLPDGEQSVLMSHEVFDRGGRFEQAPADFRFTTAVAAFGMILRDSKHKGGYTLDAVIEQARSALGSDPSGYRAEFVRLVQTAKRLRPTQ